MGGRFGDSQGMHPMAQHTSRQTNIAIYRLNRPRGQCSENMSVFEDIMEGADLEEEFFFVNSIILRIQIWQKKRINYDKF